MGKQKIDRRGGCKNAHIANCVFQRHWWGKEWLFVTWPRYSANSLLFHLCITSIKHFVNTQHRHFSEFSRACAAVSCRISCNLLSFLLISLSLRLLSLAIRCPRRWWKEFEIPKYSTVHFHCIFGYWAVATRAKKINVKCIHLVTISSLRYIVPLKSHSLIALSLLSLYDIWLRYALHLFMFVVQPCVHCYWMETAPAPVGEPGGLGPLEKICPPPPSQGTGNIFFFFK